MTRLLPGYDDFFILGKNMAMGEHRIGNCFVSGDILIFGSWAQQKEGCLQLEFFERLKNFPHGTSHSTIAPAQICGMLKRGNRCQIFMTTENMVRA